MVSLLGANDGWAAPRLVSIRSLIRRAYQTFSCGSRRNFPTPPPPLTSSPPGTQSSASSQGTTAKYLSIIILDSTCVHILKNQKCSWINKLKWLDFGLYISSINSVNDRLCFLQSQERRAKEGQFSSSFIAGLPEGYCWAVPSLATVG